MPAVDVLEFEAGAAGALAGAHAGGGDAASGPRAGAPTDLEVLVERLARGTLDAPPVHQVWLPPLEPERGLGEVAAEEPWWSAERARDGLELPVGMLDLPTQQRIEPHLLDLSGTGGHVAVVGAPRTGKSTLLRTIMASAIRRYTPDQVRFYAVDLGGGGLFALEGAPHVGGVTGKLDREAVERVVHQLRGEIEDREAAFARLRVESMAQIRSMRAAGELDGDEGELADVFLVIDGWAAFKSEFGELDREVERIAASGLSYGVHVMVTANRWADMRSALLDNFGTRLELRLNDPIDSDVSRAAAASVPAGVPGRGITSAGTHFQAALPRFDGERTQRGPERRRQPAGGGGRRSLAPPRSRADQAAAARARPVRAARAAPRRRSRSASRSAASSRCCSTRSAETRTCSCSATPRPASRRCFACWPAASRPPASRRRRSSCSWTSAARWPTSPICRTCATTRSPRRR